MRRKLSEKERAITLRKQGLSYREILKRIPVAKSSLSLWLRSVGLSKRQQQRLTEKKLASMQRGADARRKERIERTAQIKNAAKEEIKSISKRELWLMGIMLYWAEGSKEKSGRSGRVDFCNSDPYMIKLFLKWLFHICGIKKEDVNFVIHIHENSRHRIPDVINYWSNHIEFPKERITHIQFKKHNPKTKRKNIGDSYYGLLRITVRRSTDFNRKIAGWTEGISKNCGMV